MFFGAGTRLIKRAFGRAGEAKAEVRSPEIRTIDIQLESEKRKSAPAFIAQERIEKLKRALAAAPTSEQIATRAREIWESEGCPEGKDVEHWVRAEAELRDSQP